MLIVPEARQIAQELDKEDLQVFVGLHGGYKLRRRRGIKKRRGRHSFLLEYLATSTHSSRVVLTHVNNLTHVTHLTRVTHVTDVTRATRGTHLDNTIHVTHVTHMTHVAHVRRSITSRALR